MRSCVLFRAPWARHVPHGSLIRRVLSVAAPTQSSPRNPLVTSSRLLGRVSSVYGPIPSPPGGFVTGDIKLDINSAYGGTHCRSVYATREIGFGRELMNLPAFCMYIGDGAEQPLRDQVLILTKEVFSKMVCGSAEEREYVQLRVMTLMSGGFSYFTREKDVFDFAEEVRAPGKLGAIQNGVNFLMSGEFSSYDLQKLPLIIEFNRFEVEYRGRRGICLFPEASYFNHSCEPNVELAINYSSAKNNFFLSARAIRPIREGEEVVINYMPGNTLPLTRLGLAMKRRWGFECNCVLCRSRAMAAATALSLVLLFPCAYLMRRYVVHRNEEKMRTI